MIAAESGRDGDVNRLELLHGLGVAGRSPEPWLNEGVQLVADAVAAAAVAITLVDDGSAWTVAATTREWPPRGPRADSLAALAIDAPDGRVSGTIGPGDQLSDHPLLDGLETPVSFVAVAIRGSKGRALGALEVVWPGAVVDRARQAALVARFAQAAARILELEADAREYRRFIDLSPDPVAVLDQDGSIELANPALASLLGYPTTTQLRGRTFLELVAPHDRTRAAAELATVLFVSPAPRQLDLELRRRDAHIVPCSVGVGHLRGARRHLQLVIRDLTDRIRAEEVHSRLSEQLARAQRLDAVAQVASGLAHDLNNLLGVMVSNLSLAEESLTQARHSAGEDAVAPLDEDLGEIRLAVERAVELTSKLLQFGRQEGGAGDTADIAEVVETARRLVGRTLPAGITLALELAPNLPQAAADPARLERALVNLVINARDALEGSGTIRIRAAGEDGCVRVDVVDDGRGMDDEVRARAFEPLFTTRPEGTGLGLATVFALADDVDGTVDLESRLGHGTTVTLRLPVVDQPTTAVSVGVDVPVGGPRVLLVEPGERTRRVIREMLQAAGYRVRAVTTADDALIELDRDGVDLLVTELSLPGMPGARLVEHAQSTHPEVAVIALTGFDSRTSLDGVPVLVKPFSHRRLLRMVEHVVPAP